MGLQELYFNALGFRFLVRASAADRYDDGDEEKADSANCPVCKDSTFLVLNSCSRGPNFCRFGRKWTSTALRG